MLSVGPITKLTSISQTPTYLYMKLPCTYLEKNSYAAIPEAVTTLPI